MIARLRRRHRRLTLTLFVVLALLAWRRLATPTIDVRVDSLETLPSPAGSR
jgi:hypothetical protein